jgi:hypothetical protein
MTLSTRSSTISSSSEYDPWRDLNDNGKIDIYDVVELCSSYGTTGTPINKTALLYNLNATYTELLSQINSLNVSLVNLQKRVDELEAETSGFISAPAYDSGWVAIPNGTFMTFHHELDTTELFVYVVGRYESAQRPAHQVYYGGNLVATGTYRGLCWYLANKDNLVAYRYPDDLDWELVRVMLWKIPEP